MTRGSSEKHAVPGFLSFRESLVVTLTLISAVTVFTTNVFAWSKWVCMWGLAVVVYGLCKWLTWQRHQGAAVSSKGLIFVLCEPGLNAKRFLSTSLSVERPQGWEWLRSFLFIVSGAIWLWLLARFIPSEYPGLIATAGMVGLVQLLHFGTLDLLSLILRCKGYPSTPLMNAPWQATSVAEFWSRWNTGFRDFSREFIFYPLVKQKKAQLGFWGTFLFSGLIHELVISVSAHGGYGGPTLYFLLQAAAATFERSKVGQLLGLSRGWRGFAFTASVIFAPALLLFHVPFQDRVVLPMLGDWGGVP